jgi:hypothetical protein
LKYFNRKLKETRGNPAEHNLNVIPDEKAQCQQPSIDLSYIEVEDVQSHQPGERYRQGKKLRNEKIIVH